jgi:hypothetical protein
MKRVFDYWGNYLKDSDQTTNNAGELVEKVCTVAMYGIAGALARQDRAVLDLALPIREAIAGPGLIGDIVAQLMGIIVVDMPFITDVNHAKTNRLAIQRTYHFFIKPLYESSLPLAKGPAAARFAKAILSAVQLCPFVVYEDDLEILTRLVITILSGAAPSAEVLAALTVAVDIFNHETRTFKEHIKTIISGTMDAYLMALPRKQTAQVEAGDQNTDQWRVKCRGKALQLLGIIPLKLERDIVPFIPKVRQMLEAASADPSREMRKQALVTRTNWSRLF